LMIVPDLTFHKPAGAAIWSVDSSSSGSSIPTTAPESCHFIVNAPPSVGSVMLKRTRS
jgi:hypothetical protein